MRVAGLPILASGLPRERCDIAPRLGQCCAQRIVRFERSGQEFSLGDRYLIRGKSGPIEPFRQLQQRRIAPRPHVIEDGARPLLDDRVEQAGRGGQSAQALGEAGVGVADDIHGRGS